MSRKNVMLTLYLASPILVVIGLVALIFVTLDKEKLMADSPAIGAGAGDTGNANALGQWIAGRDPDAVSLAVKAKRERLMISPSDWPGGVVLSVPAAALPENASRVYLTLIYKEQGRYGTTGMRLLESEQVYQTTLDFEQLQRGSRFVISTTLPSDRDGVFVDDEGRALIVLTLSATLPSRQLDVNDPLPVSLSIDSVYADGSP